MEENGIPRRTIERADDYFSKFGEFTMHDLMRFAGQKMNSKKPAKIARAILKDWHRRGRLKGWCIIGPGGRRQYSWTLLSRGL